MEMETDAMTDIRNALGNRLVGELGMNVEAAAQVVYANFPDSTGQVQLMRPPLASVDEIQSHTAALLDGRFTVDELFAAVWGMPLALYFDLTYHPQNDVVVQRLRRRFGRRR